MDTSGTLIRDHPVVRDAPRPASPDHPDAPPLLRTTGSTGTAYLRGILSRHVVLIGPRSVAYRTAMDLQDLLLAWCDGDVRLTGSYARATGVRVGPAVDLMLPRRARPDWSARDHFYDLADYVQVNGYWPRLRHVGIGITHEDIPVDLVPVVMVPLSRDHDLYRHRMGSFVGTNLDIHVSYVNNWGFRDEIRVLKLWLERNHLQIPSFVVDLAVVHALRRRPPGDLAYNVVTVLDWMRDHIETEPLIDPANPANVVSEDVTLAERRVVSELARWSLAQRSWDRVVG